MNVFEYTEIIPAADKDADCTGLYIDDSDIIPLIIARLMVGSAQIDHMTRAVQITPNTDYLSDFYSSTETDPIKKILDYCGATLAPSDISTFYSDVKNRVANQKFYNKLLIEVSQYCTHQNGGSYTAAFVYIYRILELISFPFPLMYASQTNDFKHTYGFLKSYFDENTGNKKGELGFYKSFLNLTFNSNPIASSSVDFDLSTVPDSDLQKSLFNKIKLVSTGNILHPSTQPYDKIAVNFIEMSSFIITIRNRFFHQFNRGDTNFEESEIYDSEHVFSLLNRKCFGWICTVYFEILKNSWSRI